MGLSVDTDISADEDLWGKTVSDLQSGISVSENSITGTLKYVADYSSAFPAELDSGNYLAIHAYVPDVEDVTITVKVTNPVTLDEDGIAVLRIADKSSQTVTVVASKEGYPSITREFSLSDLICETE